MNEWISVKDRLPEDGQRILVHLDLDIEICYFSKEDGWKNMDGGDWYEIDSKYVTHWMTLPKPPAEDK